MASKTNEIETEKDFWQELEILDRQHWVSEAFKGTGRVEFKGTFRIAGEWDGELIGFEDDSQLHLLKGGTLKGIVQVQRVQIEGRCELESLTCDFLHLTRGAFVSGVIRAKTLVIDSGAIVEATFESQ
ncbi:polymer-forming cytoskeletal protein [bacterium]|nr:polymer-forming cytoskeletal protein [bacterium]